MSKNELKIKEYRFAVRVDIDNNILYAFDLDLDNNINESSEGILNYVNEEIAKKIEESLEINLSQYNVAVTDCVTSFSIPKINK